MTEKIDFTRVMPRTYRSQFRFIIDAPPDQKNKSSYYHHYMSRWSRFISQVMAIRLSKTDVRDILPEIRNTLPLDVQLSDIYPLLFQQNQSLARSLIDCASVFDRAPAELKAHIVCTFGITPDMLERYYAERDSTESAA
jgi:hypothetical protein